MLGLTDRELATAILGFLFVAAFLIVPNLRRSVGPAMFGVLRAFLAWQIQIALWLYAGYVVGLIYLASRVELWEHGILKDTIIIGVFVGFPLFMSDPARGRRGRRRRGADRVLREPRLATPLG
jgi:hypothetical protein